MKNNVLRYLTLIAATFVAFLYVADARGQEFNGNPQRGDAASPRGGMLDAARDESGAIVLAKLQESIPAELFARIKEADQNNDGLVDADEEQKLSSFFSRQRDARGDGRAPNPRASAAVVQRKRERLSADERADLERLRASLTQDGIEYLRKAQAEDGSFSASPRVGIGPTLVVTLGLLRSGMKLEDPLLDKSLKYLEKSIRPDGGVYSEGGHLATYESCLGLVCFSLANTRAGDARYDEVTRNAEKYVRGAQFNDANGFDANDEYFGGVGYGADSQTRPDLSNTQFFIEALREVGAGEDDPAIQDALVFVSRCQNLESPDSNEESIGGVKTNDGGFIYTFVAGQENPAGQEASGGLRSYGSMTYAGLKSLIYAGLTADDPRARNAIEWLRANYTLTENPGLGKRGLYYYYHTMSKCLQVLGSDTFTDKTGAERDWRAELIETLALAERVDGSWANEDRMWYETDPNLVTGYVLIVLSYCKKD